jgi:hypothetical protein
VQAQKLKGYELGTSLGDRSDTISTTVAGVEGVVCVKVDSYGNILVIKFNADVKEHILGKYGLIIKELFSIHDFLELVKVKYHVSLKNEKEDESSVGTPFEGIVYVGWNYYKEERNGVRYSVNYFCTPSSDNDEFNKLELKIEDLIALKKNENKRIDKINRKKQIEFNKKLNDF